MKLGIVGLGRMGANLVRRLLKNGHESHIRGLQLSAATGLFKEDANGAGLLQEMVLRLAQPRAIWQVVPAEVVDQALGEFDLLLHAGGIVVDRGKSYYRYDRRRAAQLQAHGIHYLDRGCR